MLGFSFWVLGVGITMAVRGNSTVCIAALRWSTLYVGLAFVVVSTIGSCGVTEKIFCLKVLYLVGLLFVLLALIVLVVFNYVAVTGKYWGPVSVCLRHRNTCDGMSQLLGDPKTGKNWTSSDDSLTISPVQSGCCKPPSSCAFTYVNGTTWSPPTPGAGGAPAAVVTNDDDCSRWSNDQRTLCFQCDSCKASVLDHIKTAWHPIGICITLFTLLSVIAYYPQVKSFDECEKLGF